jgi:hypothetical protein
MVAEINKMATVELDLHRHLFGIDRAIPPKALRNGIAALQGGHCFYCGGTLGATPEADHFIPGSAASTPSRTCCWPTGGATTTNATCSPRPRT